MTPYSYYLCDWNDGWNHACCAICGKEYDNDDDETEIIKGGFEYVCVDCLKGILTEELFWKYIKANKLMEDFLKWYYNGEGVTIKGWDSEVEKILYDGLKRYDIRIDELWEFIDNDDISDFAEWYLNDDEEEKKTD